MENKVNRKSKLKMIWILSLTLIILQVLIEKFLGLNTLILGINTNLIKLFLSLVLLLSPPCFFNYNKNKIIKKTYRVLSIILAVYIFLISIVSLSGDKYFYSS